MSNVIISPNMLLPVPVVGVDFGPDWANNLDSSLNIIDGHNHSPGSGVQITPLGLDINTNLNIQGNDLINVSGVDFSAPASSSALTRLYTNTQTGGGVVDLFYNDGAGNVIPITKAGIVNSTASSIPGESYSGGTFTWKQGAGSTTPANFDIGSVTLRPNIAATTYGITLSPPSGISSQYSLVLPALPGATSFVTLDSSGNLTATISISGGITGAMIANATITGSNIAAGTITNSNIASTVFGLSINPTVQSYTTAGTYTWTVPATVSRVIVAAIGGGGGGGGGGYTGGSFAGTQGGQTSFNGQVVGQGGLGGNGNAGNSPGSSVFGPSYDFYTGGNGTVGTATGSSGMSSQFFSGGLGGAPNTGSGGGGGGASSFAAGGLGGNGNGTNGASGTLGSGGGGGGSSSSGLATGAGGNGGRSSISVLTVTPSSSITVVVGSGGSGGAGPQAGGGNGGDGAVYIYY